MNEPLCLRLFAWTADESAAGTSGGVRPVCFDHPREEVSVKQIGRAVVVLCLKPRHEHVIGSCALGEFEAENQQALELLTGEK